ncbi:MAG: hypothetical protein ACP5QT_03370 [Brevinematia bacterium]
MVKFLKRKLFIAFFVFGGVFSIILGLFSKSNVVILLLKSLLTALLLGAFGLGLDIFLINTIGEDEYEKLFSLSSEKGSDVTGEKAGKIDIKEEVSEEEKNIYEDVIYQSKAQRKEEVEVPEEKKVDRYDFSTYEEKDELKESMATETPSSTPDILEESQKLKEMERELKATKSKDYREGEVSFQVKNRKINTTPEVVAKAIKTILKRDEG